MIIQIQRELLIKFLILFFLAGLTRSKNLVLYFIIFIIPYPLHFFFLFYFLRFSFSTKEKIIDFLLFLVFLLPTLFGIAVLLTDGFGTFTLTSSVGVYHNSSTQLFLK